MAITMSGMKSKIQSSPYACINATASKLPPLLTACNFPTRAPVKKNFKLGKDEITPVANGYGSCIATDQITVEGWPVGFMYREQPDNCIDSGWRFMSGFESDEYMNNPENHAAYDVNTIANYDPSIIPFLDAPIGSAYEKSPESGHLIPVNDCTGS